MDDKTSGLSSDAEKREYLHDKDILGGDIAHGREEAFHFAHLSEEELLIEKKLKRKIDCTIMPLVVLVSLANKKQCEARMWKTGRARDARRVSRTLC